MRSVLTVALLTLFFISSTASATTTNRTEATQSKLRQVQKIFIGDMGRADEAERFRFLLEEQLIKKGFTVVAKEAEADAILNGALSVRVHDDDTEARVYVTLTTTGGERLWARDFGNRLLTNPLNRKEPTKRRAEDVANGLRRDWEKAGK